MDKHEEIKQLISAYIDGEASSDEARTIEEHIKACPSCSQYMKEVTTLSSCLSSWPDEELSPDSEQKINKGFYAQKKQEEKEMKKTTLSITRIGGGVLVTVLISVLVLHNYAQRSLQGRFKSAADDIGGQFSPGSTKVLSSRVTGTSVQYEPYYLSSNAPTKTKSAVMHDKLAETDSSMRTRTKAGYQSSSYTVGREMTQANHRMIADRIGPIDSFGPMEGLTQPMYGTEGFTTENYDRIYENEFLTSKDNPLSTFSIDVDTASYSNLRRFLNNGQMPPQDAVRIEEMVNYFSYDYPQPEGDDPFSITTKAATCPWNNGHKLAMIGLKGKSLESEKIPPSNLVFLLDVSGSMNQPNKLPLLKSAFRLLVNQLSDNEKVAIVVYAGAAGEVLESTPGSNKMKILNAIDRLNAGGSTAGGAGIKLAYEIASKNYVKGGNNRVILATDGDFNIGASSDAEMIRLIEGKRDQGVFLTVLGFGMGNYKDNKVEKIADAGNGNYYYIDTLNEAKKVLVQELGSTLFTIAKDVKIQIEFNPAQVKAYRLIGYENRMLAKEDFNNDKKDAGELGAGHTVTALYEIIPADSQEIVSNVDELSYQNTTVVKSDDLMTVKLRYKKPDEDTSKLITKAIKESQITQDLNSDFKFAAAVAEFGLVLRNSKYKANASYGHAEQAVKESKGQDKFGYRQELIDLIEKAKNLDMRASEGQGIQFK